MFFHCVKILFIIYSIISIEIKAKIEWPRDKYKCRIIGGIHYNHLGHHIAFLRIWVIFISANKLIMFCQIWSKAGVFLNLQCFQACSLKCNIHIVNSVKCGTQVQQKETETFSLSETSRIICAITCIWKPDWNTPCLFLLFFPSH